MLLIQKSIFVAISLKNHIMLIFNVLEIIWVQFFSIIKITVEIKSKNSR